MSEAIFAEVHETEHTVEVRWDYNGRIYGILMSQEMFDLLEISSGQQTPALVKVSIGLDHPAWSGGVVLTDEGFVQFQERFEK